MRESILLRRERVDELNFFRIKRVVRLRKKKKSCWLNSRSKMKCNQLSSYNIEMKFLLIIIVLYKDEIFINHYRVVWRWNFYWSSSCCSEMKFVIIAIGLQYWNEIFSQYWDSVAYDENFIFVLNFDRDDYNTIMISRNFMRLEHDWWLMKISFQYWALVAMITAR